MSVKPIPEGYHSVTPYLAVKGAAKAIDFYKQAFGATELFRMQSPDGNIGHAEIKIGDCIIMIADEYPDMKWLSPTSIGGSGTLLMIYTDDCDAMFNRAVGAGGKETRPLADQFYGDRSGTIEDPFGHKWTIATHKEDLSPDEIDKRAKEAMATSA
jgi:PhnB protein